MAYASYEFYTMDYFGDAVPVSDFPRLAERASEYIDYITRGKAAKCADLAPIQKACCALAEHYQVIDKARAAAASENGELAAQTVGSWSKTYRSGTETAKEYEAQLYSIAQRYLLPTGLLYRGGGCSCFPTL